MPLEVEKILNARRNALASQGARQTSKAVEDGLHETITRPISELTRRRR